MQIQHERVKLDILINKLKGVLETGFIWDKHDKVWSEYCIHDV